MPTYPKYLRPLPMRVTEDQFQAFLENLDAPDVHVRMDAISWLGYIQDDRAFDPVRPLLAHPDPTVACEVLQALYLMNPPRAVPYLVHALTDHRPRVRCDAARQLGFAQDEIAFEPLQRLLADHDANVRCAALAALSLYDEQVSLPIVLAALRDPDGTFRLCATECLMDTEDPTIVEPLIHALSDVKPEVRYNAAYILGDRGILRARPALIGVLQHDRAEAFDGRLVWAVARQAIQKIDMQHQGYSTIDDEYPLPVCDCEDSRESEIYDDTELPF